jgi:hypothetical protein
MTNSPHVGTWSNASVIDESMSRRLTSPRTKMTKELNMDYITICLPPSMADLPFKSGFALGNILPGPMIIAIYHLPLASWPARSRIDAHDAFHRKKQSLHLRRSILNATNDNLTTALCLASYACGMQRSERRILSAHAASASVIDLSPHSRHFPLLFHHLHKRICNARSTHSVAGLLVFLDRLVQRRDVCNYIMTSRP